MNTLLLDTNAFNKIAQGDITLIELMSSCDAIYVSVIVLGELQIGFKGGNREKQNKNKLDNFLSSPGVKICHVNEETAEIYSQIVHDLYKKGKPIPTNDIWIASQTMELGAVLVTYDTHFQEIPGLRVWKG